MRGLAKTALGFVVAFLLGLVCRVFDIPSPAPPVLTGALLVLAMTLGHSVADWVMRRRPDGPEDEGKGDVP
jgi:XapX domain-containing protein